MSNDYDTHIDDVQSILGQDVRTFFVIGVRETPDDPQYDVRVHNTLGLSDETEAPEDGIDMLVQHFLIMAETAGAPLEEFALSLALQARERREGTYRPDGEQ